MGATIRERLAAKRAAERGQEDYVVEPAANGRVITVEKEQPVAVVAAAAPAAKPARASKTKEGKPKESTPRAAGEKAEMPEITLAMVNAVIAEFAKAKTADDIRAVWKANFLTMGHRRLGRILANPNYDPAKLVRA